MSSVARPDDGVHRFFTTKARSVLAALIDPKVLGELARPFRPRRRARRFDVPTMVWLGVFGAAHAVARSMEEILATACAALEDTPWLPVRAGTLTQSGWSRAKERMSLGFLRRLWRHWVEAARHVAGEDAYFHGLRLVALDKKTVRVPEALWGVFGSHRARKGDGPAQGALVVAYDVCVRVPVALTLGRADTHERTLAPRILGDLASPGLFLIDAGFYSIGLFAAICARGHHFLTRMSSSGRPKLLRRLGPSDGLYEIRPGHSWPAGVDVPKPMTVRIVRVQWKGFRPVRLVTSLLDADAVPRSDLIDLYHRRWHIETFFRELGEDVHFEHWHTRTLKGLYVELLFTMINVAVVRAVMAEAAVRAGVLPGLLSFGRSAPVCIRAWCRVGKSEPSQRGALLRELVGYLATLDIDVRPGRCFERDTQKRRAASRKRKQQASRRQTHVA